MLLQMYGLGQALELVTAGTDDDEGLSNDEMPVGNIITGGGQSVILSGETLTRVKMAVNLSNPSDIDSLLLDNAGGGGGNGSDGDGENGEDMSEPEHDSDSEEDTFEYDWCEAEPNTISPELPVFQEPIGPSDEAKIPRHHLSVSSLFLLLC